MSVVATSLPLTALQIGMTAGAGRGGGVDRYYFNLLRALVPHGIESRGLVTGSADAVNGERVSGVAAFAPDSAGLIHRWQALRTAIAPIVPDADLVVSHFAPYAFPVLDRIRARPLVVHFHGPWALESAIEGSRGAAVLVKRTIERIVYRAAARFIVLSHAFGDILQDHYGVPADVIRVVPGGVDLQRFEIRQTRSAARAILGWPDRPTVVTVRRLVHAKGIENLIAAAAIVRREVPDIFIAIAGTGPLAADLQLRIQEAGLQDTVRLCGFVPDDDLPVLYRAADLMIVPTLALEGFGLVVIEALACGTPVLVTPIAGLPDVVRGLDSSLVLTSSQPVDIAAGICDALSGRVPLPSEEACVAHAQQFGWPLISERVGDVYREVA